MNRLLARALALLAKLKLETSAISFKALPILGRVARTNAPLVVVLLLVAPVPTARSQNASAPFPSRLGTYLRDAVRLTVEEQQQLAAGEPVTKLLDGDESKEVAVFGAIWINAPIRQYANAVRDIENFERGGGFKVTKRISSPPRLEDFAQLQLPPEDVADLRACRVDDCELKLGEEALNRFRSQIDWNAPDTNGSANRLMRQLAFEYTARYLKGGNDSLAVYRDNTRPTFVAQEFRSMVDSMPELTTYMPDIRKHLLEYPKSRLTECHEPVVLAGDRVRPEAHASHQSPDGPRGSERRRRRLQDAVCEPLFLDGTRAPRARVRPGARARILARDRQSQPLGRPQWVHRHVSAATSENGSTGRSDGGAADDETETGSALGWSARRCNSWSFVSKRVRSVRQAALGHRAGR